MHILQTVETHGFGRAEKIQTYIVHARPKPPGSSYEFIFIKSIVILYYC